MLHRRAWIYNRAHPYIPYYNREAALTCTATGVAVVSGIGAGAALDGVPSSGVQVRIGGLCGCCIAFVGIGQINGNATVKPCKRFWRCCGIICMDGRKAAVKACMWLYCSLAK